LILRHELGFGKAGVLVGGREAADAHRLAHRILDAGRREIGRACAAFALVAIHGDREPAVALALDRFELPHAHGNGQAFLVACADLRLIGALPARKRDCVRSNGFQRFANRVLIHVVMTSCKKRILTAVQCPDETIGRRHHGVPLGLVHDDARDRYADGARRAVRNTRRLGASHT
jgi:hypothetical protein